MPSPLLEPLQEKQIDSASKRSRAVVDSHTPVILSGSEESHTMGIEILRCRSE